MEWHYLTSANALHQVRINRMRRQKGGFNQDGKPTPNTALDLHLERMMPIYKAVKHRNSAESWVEISKYIPFSMRCRKFTDAEMSRRKLLEFIEAEQAVEAGLLPPTGTEIADPTRANKTTTVPNATKNLVLITEGLVLAGITTETASRQFDDMHFWRAFNATTTDIKATKRTEEAMAGEDRLRQASTAETATTEMVATIFEGVTASRKRDRVGNDEVIADDTNIGDTDDKSLYDEDDEAVPWVEGDTFVDAGEPLVVVHDDEDPDDDNDDDNVEVPETQFGYDDWINDAATDEADSADEGDDTELVEDKQVIVDEEVEQIRKKVQMKIEPMNKSIGGTDFYKDEIARLKKKNVVTLRKLKRDRDVRSNEFLKKKLYERLVTMEKRGIVERANVEDSQRLQGAKFWQSYLSNS
jgi:hypothetical protein